MPIPLDCGCQLLISILDNHYPGVLGVDSTRVLRPLRFDSDRAHD